MVESNSLIKASAGTGKTFALATRFIRLMLIDGVEPATIVALTFSRAAAQEIYAKILDRLAMAAKDDDGARREWGNLLEDFRRGRMPQSREKLAWIESRGIPHGTDAFRVLLRRLVDTQHLGTIATLDSFILRIVRNFPLEMGFQSAVEVLDPADEGLAVEDALKSALSLPGDGGRRIAEAFAAAGEGDFPRACIDSISAILGRGGWRDFAISHPECIDDSSPWTVESMCAALGVPLESECPDLSGIPVNEIKRANASSPEEKFIKLARTYDGRGTFLPTGVTGALIRHFWDNPGATSFKYKFYNKEYVLDCGAEGAAAIRGAIRHMANLHLRRRMETVKAKLDLVKAVEAEYSRLTRRMGRLTFGDFTKFSSESEFSERGIAIKNVQFRFDSAFDHWALDEFQDTSEMQWKCLRELFAEAAQAGRSGEGRSAMAVGDLKQSIYTWRGASARPFEDISGWSAFDGCSYDLKESHRYGPNIAAFVNMVFGAGNIAPGPFFPAACAPAVAEWADGWVDHVSHEASDYVKAVAVANGADSDGDEMMSALCEEVRRLWERHQAAGSADTVAIIVRSNDDGLEVAEHLRANGLPVVWEGVNPVCDVPAVQAVLALLKLADHPEDSAAWRTVNDLFPLRAALFPGLGDAAGVSAAVSRMLSRQGLARVLKDFGEAMRGCIDPASASLERLRQMVEMAVAFEGKPEGGGSVDEFVRYLERAQKREVAVSSEVIRVLTIHRSKGLGFDHVFVPLFESGRERSSIDRPKQTAPLYDEGPWVLPHLAKGVEKFNPAASRAYDRMRSDRLKEALRTYYVAMTRAKKSMFVIFPDDSDPDDYGKGLLMRDLVVQAVGRRLPFEAGEYPSCRTAGERSAATQAPAGWRASGMREVVERVSPSAAGGAASPRVAADALFDAGRGDAARKGVEAHERYQAVEWLDASEAESLQEGFREAFVRPSPDASVWRERSYELYSDGRWETGQFDRVVFSGSGEARSATIYDFKTNVMRAAETDDAFAARMRTAYGRQMEHYRDALAALTGIPPERISCKLLLQHNGKSVSVQPGIPPGQDAHAERFRQKPPII